MPFIVDGHNLIPNLSGVDLTDLDDEMQLVDRLHQFSQRVRTTIEVYFDHGPPGQARQQTFGFVVAFFVPEGQTADLAIKKRLASLGKEARNWTVISSDREVLRAAKFHQARARSASDFATLMAEKSKPEEEISDAKWDPELSAEEVEYWRRRFLDDDS